MSCHDYKTFLILIKISTKIYGKYLFSSVINTLNFLRILKIRTIVCLINDIYKEISLSILYNMLILDVFILF